MDVQFLKSPLLCASSSSCPKAHTTLAEGKFAIVVLNKRDPLFQNPRREEIRLWTPLNCALGSNFDHPFRSGVSLGLIVVLLAFLETLELCELGVVSRCDCVMHCVGMEWLRVCAWRSCLLMSMLLLSGLSLSDFLSCANMLSFGACLLLPTWTLVCLFL
ncbi:hypothetical protein VNO77_19608 [Canavalia gladiata]|uniref:Uncharacterized protein n=1 Tax=Canavalia gladiata TaxID=3824 RepID=A0AAN9QPS7_CANGL